MKINNLNFFAGNKKYLDVCYPGIVSSKTTMNKRFCKKSEFPKIFTTTSYNICLLNYLNNNTFLQYETFYLHLVCVF